VEDVLTAAFDGASPVSRPRRVGSRERKAAAGA
jgi:hypothetical protein